MPRPTDQTSMTGERADDGHDNDRVTVWCETCQHVHIAAIPGVTWLCRNCGWGQWSEESAAAHVESCPGHEPYRVGHHIPERFRDVRKAGRVEALAPIAALVVRADAAVEGKWGQVSQVRSDDIDTILGDVSDAIRVHNAAIWDQGHTVGAHDVVNVQLWNRTPTPNPWNPPPAASTDRAAGDAR